MFEMHDGSHENERWSTLQENWQSDAKAGASKEKNQGVCPALFVVSQGATHKHPLAFVAFITTTGRDC